MLIKQTLKDAGMTKQKLYLALAYAIILLLLMFIFIFGTLSLYAQTHMQFHSCYTPVHIRV